MFDTYIGTTNGVFRLQRNEAEPLGLDGERIWAIHAFVDNGDTVILAGSYGNGLFRSTDGGQTWHPANDGLTAAAFRCIGPDPLRPDAILAGTEPGRIYRSTNGGQSWSELDGITRIEGHEDWFLPYSPRAGAVRNVYAPDQNGRRLLASVEVGGLLDSADGGESWTCAPIGIDDDIHHITGHPDDPDLLYASLGYASLRHDRHAVDGRRFGGIARSRDGGRNWQKLENDYTRATLIPPSRRDLLVAGPAPKVSQGGRIVVSSDGGDTWQPASSGIETPMPDMVELFVAAPDDSIWAVCSGGRLLRAEAGEWHWESAVPQGADLNVQSVAFVGR
jgi:photosystem II stability/assembly factor-like uncharacterized protein